MVKIEGLDEAFAIMSGFYVFIKRLIARLRLGMYLSNLQFQFRDLDLVTYIYLDTKKQP